MSPIIYFLFLLGFTYAIAKLNTAKNIQKLDWKSYSLLLKSLLSYQIDQDKEKLQEVFMRTMVDLGKEAVKNKKPMASYYLPNGKKVVVITNPQLLDQLYHPKNVKKIAQTNLLKRLDAIMGPNFMTLPTHSPYHNDLRAAIYQRNEKKNNY